MNRFFVALLRWVVALALPAFLILSVARLFIADWYPRVEYAKPDFPRDVYGWSQRERLDLALPSIHFLNSPQPPEQAISLLREQRMPATDQPLFTANELSHMVDVKRLIDVLWRVQLVSGVLILGSLVILLANRATRRSAYLALMFGGVLTTGLLLVMAFFVLVGFDAFFVQFHEVFFPQGNWTFDYRDSLIRLFPEKLWFDAGFMIAVSTLLAGLATTGLGWLLWRGSRKGAAGAAAKRGQAELVEDN